MPIIPRNSTVPISRVEAIRPVHEDQSVILFEIYQGENPLVEKNIYLGELEVAIPDKKTNNQIVDIRFTYDINGILQVEATVKHTGVTTELILQQHNSSMSEEEIQTRLNALSQLKIHPRNKQENTLLIAKASRLYEEYIDYRDDLQNLLAEFKDMLETQDEDKIISYRNHLKHMLNQIESD